MRQRWIGVVVSEAQLLENGRHNLRGFRTCLLKRDAVGQPQTIAQLPLDRVKDDRRIGGIQIIQDLRAHSATPSLSLSQWEEAYAGMFAMHTRKKVDFRVIPTVGKLLPAKRTNVAEQL
ncbi:hypothetical protein DXK93_01565 [Achromobacter sp. K91]|nr:hypothetical protein DXK93_01565 [Achromobacter sp. K91]